MVDKNKDEKDTTQPYFDLVNDLLKKYKERGYEIDDHGQGQVFVNHMTGPYETWAEALRSIMKQEGDL